LFHNLQNNFFLGKWQPYLKAATCIHKSFWNPIWTTWAGFQKLLGLISCSYGVSSGLHKPVHFVTTYQQLSETLSWKDQQLSESFKPSLKTLVVFAHATADVSERGIASIHLDVQW
jgi:hypothetical protein